MLLYCGRARFSTSKEEKHPGMILKMKTQLIHHALFDSKHLETCPFQYTKTFKIAQHFKFQIKIDTAYWVSKLLYIREGANISYIPCSCDLSNRNCMPKEPSMPPVRWWMPSEYLLLQQAPWPFQILALTCTYYKHWTSKWHQGLSLWIEIIM